VCRLYGNLFCLYITKRLVVPSLKQTDLPKFQNGQLRPDSSTKSDSHDHLDYQYVIVTSTEAYAVEIKARNGDLFVQKSMLNPICM